MLGMSVAARIVEHVLVRRAFGATVWAVKTQWATFVDTIGQDAGMLRLISGPATAQSDGAKVTVYLVGRRE